MKGQLIKLDKSRILKPLIAKEVIFFLALPSEKIMAKVTFEKGQINYLVKNLEDLTKEELIIGVYSTQEKLQNFPIVSHEKTIDLL